jgi:toxin ParE1/3/4
MKVEFHSKALAEMSSAAEYYDSRQPGLGDRFLDAISEAVERIERDPLAWSAAGEDVRRCLTRVFPYSILYAVERDLILVLAVAHLSREPGYWEPRG